jgi:hypothetical protein
MPIFGPFAINPPVYKEFVMIFFDFTTNFTNICKNIALFLAESIIINYKEKKEADYGGRLD